MDDNLTKQPIPIKSRPSLSTEDEIALIRKRLGHPTKTELKYWLNTGNALLNSVFASEKEGLPYGKQYEIAGWESHGKSALTYELAGYAQRDGAEIAIWDLEDSWDPDWARALGLDPTRVFVFRPIIGKFEGEKLVRPITAQEESEQLEEWMKDRHDANPNGRLFLAVDSIAGMMTADEEAAGISEQNMRTKVSVATFLSYLTKRWQKRASNWNVMIIYVNQLRVAPGKWGNPEYTTGGNAMRFACTSRVKVRRKSGKLLKDGKSIGFKGVIQNWKNKAGEGSREGLIIGFKRYYDGRAKYVPAIEIENKKED